MFASSTLRRIRTRREKAKILWNHTQHTYKKEKKEKHNDILWRATQRTPPNSIFCIFHPNAHETWNWTRLAVFFTIFSTFSFFNILSVCRRAVSWSANNMMNVEKLLTFPFSFSSHSSSCSLFCMSFCFVIRSLIVCLNVYSSSQVCVAARMFIFFFFSFTSAFQEIMKKDGEEAGKWKWKKDGSQIMD